MRRLHFISHSMAPVDAPAENVGGMQRVAEDLLTELEASRRVAVAPILLRSEWSAIRARAPLFLASIGPRLLCEAGPGDAVLFSSMTSAAVASPAFAALRSRGVRTGAIVHGLDVTFASLPYQMAVRRALPRLDCVFPVSHATAAQCVARGRAHVEVVPNGVDVSRFSGRFLESPPRRDQPVHRLLAIGRMVPRKGLRWFVERVMPLLPDRVELVLVGDGPERDSIERSILELGLRSRVLLRGRVSDAELALELEAADILVMPNLPVRDDLEGFGVVILEAALAGVPSVVARLDGMVDVVSNGVTGRTVTAGDAGAFACTLTEMIENESTTRSMGLRARSRCFSDHAWAAVAARYVDTVFSAKSVDEVRESVAASPDP